MPEGKCYYCLSNYLSITYGHIRGLDMATCRKGGLQARMVDILLALQLVASLFSREQVVWQVAGADKDLIPRVTTALLWHRDRLI